MNDPLKEENIQFQFPSIQNSWHVIGKSKDFKVGKAVSVKLGDREWLAYRDSLGVLHVIHSRCPHMGANLTYASIENDQIVCPFHGWKFSKEGACTQSSESGYIPEYAKLQTYTVRERHGLAFFYLGKTPAYELPFFPDTDPDDFYHDEIQEIEQDCGWYVVPSNAFDLSHFTIMHKMIPVKPPQLIDMGPYARRIVLHYEMKGNLLSDKILRFLHGKTGVLDFTVWSGNMIYATTRVGKFINYMMIFIEPLPGGHSVSRMYVYSPGAKRGWWYRALNWIPMRVLSILNQKFFQNEADTLKSVRFNSVTFLPSDQMLKDYLVWLVNLKQ